MFDEQSTITLLVTTLMIFGAQAEPELLATHTVRNVTLNAHGSVTSLDFPVSCCGPQTVTLTFVGDGLAYIHIGFDDLDIPPETHLRIYRSTNESRAYMTRAQPRIRYGIWERPFVTSNSSQIHLVLRPPLNLSYDPKNYAGFKISYIVLRQLCPRIMTALEGWEVRVKPQAHPELLDKWFDCVWHIKPAGSSEERTADTSLRTYVRITEANVSAQSNITVRFGRSSRGVILGSGVTLSALDQPPAGFEGRQDGLYVRVYMPADDRSNVFSFVYGVMHRIDPGVAKMCSPGYICRKPYNSICIPPEDVCNSYDNCPLGDDEANCPEATSGGGRLEGLPQEEKKCKSEFHKKCNDGSCIYKTKLCPEDSCHRYRPHRCDICYSDADKCDKKRDCESGEDEKNCVNIADYIQRQLYYLFIVPAFVISSLVVFYKFCCTHKEEPSRSAGRTDLTGRQPSVSLHHGGPSTIPGSRRHSVASRQPSNTSQRLSPTLSRHNSRRRSPTPQGGRSPSLTRRGSSRQRPPPHSPTNLTPGDTRGSLRVSPSRHRSGSRSSRHRSPSHSPSRRRGRHLPPLEIPLPDNHRHDNNDDNDSDVNLSDGDVESLLPPPTYEEVTMTDTYARPAQSNQACLETPPPAYDKAIKGPQLQPCGPRPPLLYLTQSSTG